MPVPDLPFWKHVVMAGIVAAAMALGSAVAGTCGLIVLGISTYVVLQVLRVGLNEVRETYARAADDDPPEP